MANPGALNLSLPRGSDWDYEIGFLDPAGLVIEDLDERDLLAEVRPTTYTPLTPLTITLDGATLRLSLTEVETLTMPTLGHWQLLQNAPGRQTTLLAGRFEVVGP